MYFYNQHKTLITLLALSFLLFFINIDFQITKFGKILKNQDGSEYHGIIKSPPELNIWKMSTNADDLPNGGLKVQPLLNNTNISSISYDHNFRHQIF